MQKYGYSDLNKSNSNLSTDSLEVKDSNVNNKIYDRQNNKLNLKCINKKSNVKSTADSSKINTEDETSVPFYSGELSLSEIQKLQKNARKKIIICGKSNSNNKKHKNNNIINMFNENELKIELNCFSIPTSSSVKSGYTKNNGPSASNSLRTCRSLTRKNSTNIRERERSVSYLEQYKKRLELKNKTQNLHKTDSVCSTGNSTNRSPISVIDLTSDTYSKCYTNCDCDENESFYQSIIQNGCKDHSSPRNIEYIYSRSITSNKTSSDIDISFNEEKIDSDGNSKMKSKCEKNDNGNKKERRRKSAKAVLIPVRFGTLGPDTEKTKPKLEAFLKRKEYGNNVSCKNRIEVLQRRETHSFKAIIPSQGHSEVPVPVVTYSLVPNMHVEDNKIKKDKTKNSTTAQSKANKETVINTKKKNNNTNIYGMNRTKQKNNEQISDNNNNTTQLLLQRHQMEKKLAENIRNQLSKK